MEQKEDAPSINNGEVRNNGLKQEEEEEGKGEKQQQQQQLPLMALNHVSRLCRNLEESIKFYTNVLGMVLIERPQAFDFDGAWLFNYGVGIHLLQSGDEDRLPDTNRKLDPMDNHISFQCENMEAMEQRMKEFGVNYMKRALEDENGTRIDQLFFNDPDGFMIEICNCENLRLVPAGSLGKIKLPFDRHNPPFEMQNGNENDASK